MPGGGRVDSGLVPEIKAARGEGTAGTFTAENMQCSRGSCYWHGSFWSADGSLRFSDAWMYGHHKDDLSVGERPKRKRIKR